MKGTFVIAGRELRAYFSTPVAWAVIALVGFLSALFFNGTVHLYQEQSDIPIQFQNPELMRFINANDMVVQPLFGNLGIVTAFVLPLLTMRLIAEERKQLTYELLLTAPVSTWGIVLGKFLGVMGVLCTIALLSFIYPLSMQFFADAGIEWVPVATGYLGLVLMSSAFAALGLFFSAITQNQIIAALVTFVIFLALWVVQFIASWGAGALSEVLRYISLFTHFESFTNGVLELRSVVYFVSVTLLGLYMSHQAIESHRWRGV